MMTFGDMLGWFAAGLVFSTFLARRMRPLRTLAIFSNIAFIAYGGLYHLWPIVGLHLSMLPVNVVRLRETLAVAEVSLTDAAGLVPTPRRRAAPAAARSPRAAVVAGFTGVPRLEAPAPSPAPVRRGLTLAHPENIS